MATVYEIVQGLITSRSQCVRRRPRRKRTNRSRPAPSVKEKKEIHCSTKRVMDGFGVRVLRQHDVPVIPWPRFNLKKCMRQALKVDTVAKQIADIAELPAERIQEDHWRFSHSHQLKARLMSVLKTPPAYALGSQPRCTTVLAV